MEDSAAADLGASLLGKEHSDDGSDSEEMATQAFIVDHRDTAYKPSLPFRCLKSLRFVVVAIWLTTSYFGLRDGVKFFSETSFSFDPPNTARAITVRRKFRTFDFPNAYDGSMEERGVLMVRSLVGKSVLTPTLEEFTRFLQVNLETHQNFCGLHSFYSTAPEQRALLAQQFLGPAVFDENGMHATTTNTSALFVIQTCSAREERLKSINRMALKLCNEASAPGGMLAADSMKAYYTQHHAMLFSTQDQLAADIEGSDSVTVPIAFVILFAALGTPALVVLTTLPMSALSTLLVLERLARTDEYPSFAPAIIVSLMVAMTIDYALFMLTRFSEELRMNKSVLEAIDTALTRAGRTILVSAGVLIGAFMGLVSIQTSFIRTLGAGSAVTIAFTMLASLTALPAVLIIFSHDLPAVISRAKRAICRCLSIEQVGAEENDADTRAAWCCLCTSKAGSYLWRRTMPDGVRSRFEGFDVWRPLGRLCLLHPLKVCVGVTAAAIPFVALCYFIRLSENNEQLFPRNALVVQNFDAIRSERYQLGQLALEFLVLRVPGLGPSGTRDAVEWRGSIPPPNCTDNDDSLSALAETYLGLPVESCAAAAALVDLCSEELAFLDDMQQPPPPYGSMESFKWAVQVGVRQVCPQTCGYCASANASAFSQQYFDASNRMIELLLDLKPDAAVARTKHGFQSLLPGHVSAISWPFGQPITLAYAMSLLNESRKAAEDAVAYCADLPTEEGCRAAAKSPYGCAWEENYDGVCVKLARTGGCSSSGVREPFKDQGCAAVISPEVSGACQCSCGSELPFNCESTMAGKTCGEACYRNCTQPGVLPMHACVAHGAGLVSAEAAAYQDIVRRLVNEEYSSAMIELTSPYDTWGDQAIALRKYITPLLRTRDLYVKLFGVDTFDRATAGGQEIVYFVSPIGAFVDLVDEVYEQAPVVMAIVVPCVIVTFASLAFRSIFVGLRMLLTIILTIVWVAGASVLVFQLAPSGPQAYGLYWMVPIAQLPVLAGLTLDYDMFLISRIYEYRTLSNGRALTTRAAVVKGLEKTGGVITTAGIIMMVAFCALVASPELVLNEFGFVLTFASFIDTFVVRTLLVPSLLLLFPKWTWWPGKVPEASVDLEPYYNGRSGVGTGIRYPEEEAGDDVQRSCCEARRRSSEMTSLYNVMNPDEIEATTSYVQM